MTSAAHTTPAPRRNALAALAALAVFAAALLPRALDLGGFLTVDEANFWIARSETFLGAIRRGDWAATAISTHPGVTTMWLGSAGLVLRELLVDPGLLPGDFPTALALMRLPAAVVHAAAVALGYLLMRRIAPRPALLAALLWAADPFVVAYSRLLHVDALAGTFMTLSALAACGYWCYGRGRGWLALSALAGGLALLSKSPSLVLLPLVGALALSGVAAAREQAAPRARPPAALLALLAWGAIAGLTAAALWPALWADPLGALGRMRTGVEAEGAQPHMLGNFFLGRQDDAPGALFYPVALALRLTPISLAGLLALGALAAAALVRRRPPPAELALLGAMALLALLLTAGLSVFPKKFNRYLEPAFPALDILAAAGLAQLGALLAGRLRAGRALFQPLAGALVACLALGNAALWHPYGIAAFNQALGGAPAGARTFAVGWGEGLEQASAWLNEQPDITGVATVSRIPVVQAPYMRRGASVRTPQGGALPEATGYVVVYVSQVQRGAPSPPFDGLYGSAVPLHTVHIHGVDYAWIYQVPASAAEARPAAFGDAIRLRGFTWAARPERGAAAVLRLQWDVRAPVRQDYTLFAHLVGPEGRRYAQVDIPLPTGGWQPGRYPAVEVPLAVPADAPAGDYHVVIGLYDPAGGARLPLATALPTDDSLSGADALPLAELRIE